MRRKRLALASSLTALYIVANGIPISAFIGGAGFITVGIMVLPVIAAILSPREAVIVAIIAPLGLFALGLSIIPVFGFFGLLIPSSAIILGSLGFHKSPLYPASYIVFGAIWYILFSGGTPLWLVPYAVAILSTVWHLTRKGGSNARTSIVVLSLNATMCELVTMNIGSISVLNLPGQLWTIISPIMFFERTIAVIGSSLILFALMRVRQVTGILGDLGKRYNPVLDDSR